MMVVTRFQPMHGPFLSLRIPTSCVLLLMAVPTMNLSPSAHLEVIHNRPSRIISPSMLNKGDAISLCKRTMHEKSQTLPIPILCSHILTPCAHNPGRMFSICTSPCGIYALESSYSTFVPGFRASLLVHMRLLETF